MVKTWSTYTKLVHKGRVFDAHQLISGLSFNLINIIL